MKSVMISIKPKWCRLIAMRQKTVEVRKTRPKIEPPFKCYIYHTITRNAGVELNHWCDCWELYDGEFINAGGKVIGEFVCDKIYKICPNGSGFTVDNDIALTNRIANQSCLDFVDMKNYLGTKGGYAWHISDLKIYDKPKELSEFNAHIKCPNAKCSEFDGEWYCEDGYEKCATVDKTRDFPFNDECIYFNCPSCVGESSENEEYAYCMCKGYKPVIKPPQSWCYVEEIKE